MTANHSRTRMVLSIFWMVLGAGGIIGMVLESMRIATDPELPLPAILGTVPFLLAASAAAWNGWGLLRQRRWARPATLILSTLVVVWGLPALLLIGADQGLLPLVLVALVVVAAAFSLWFAARKMNPQRVQ